MNFDHVPSETDTKLYDSLSQVKIQTLAEVKDIMAGRLTGETVAEGEYITSNWGGWYLRILILINQFVDGSLFGKKLFNLAWYAPTICATVALISLACGGAVGRNAWLPITLIPTLWYPVIVLYRDIVTTFTHLAVFLAAINFILDREGRRGAAVLFMFGVAVGLLLRPGTLVINGVIVAGVWLSARYCFRSGSHRTKSFAAAVAICVVGAAALYFAVGGDIATVTHSVEKSIRADVRGIVPRVTQAIATLHLFVASEPVLFSKDYDGNIEQLRGALNGVWFALWVPFVLFGLIHSAKIIFKSARMLPVSMGRAQGRPQGRADAGMEAGHITRFVVTCCASYVACWWVITTELADFTRWRLPVVPVLAIFGVIGWRALNGATRVVMWVAWWLTIAVWRFAL